MTRTPPPGHWVVVFKHVSSGACETYKVRAVWKPDAADAGIVAHAKVHPDPIEGDAWAIFAVRRTAS